MLETRKGAAPLPVSMQLFSLEAVFPKTFKPRFLVVFPGPKTLLALYVSTTWIKRMENTRTGRKTGSRTPIAVRNKSISYPMSAHGTCQYLPSTDCSTGPMPKTNFDRGRSSAELNLELPPPSRPAILGMTNHPVNHPTQCCMLQTAVFVILFHLPCLTFLLTAFLLVTVLWRFREPRVVRVLHQYLLEYWRCWTHIFTVFAFPSQGTRCVTYVLISTSPSGDYGRILELALYRS